MMRARRPSPQTVAVLAALAVDPGRSRYGYELGQELGLKAGSLYPILIRLCDRGLLEARWEAEPAVGRPPRHLYRLTDAGLRLAAETAAAPAAAPAAAVPAAAAQAAPAHPAPARVDADASPRRDLRGAW